MADKKKKMAAALSAVSTYLQQEEAAALQQQAEQQATAVSADYGASMWSHSGRHEMMGMRRLIQLRVFDRFR